MKKYFSILPMLFFVTATFIQAQTMPRANADVSGITLKIQDSEGTNGSAVAWNPIQRKYYAAIAGNTVYPLETFDFDGTPLGSVPAGVDIRGMWWNSKTNHLECNEYGYNDNDVITTTWSILGVENGLANGETSVIRDGSPAPSEQSIGCFDEIKNRVLYYDSGVIYSASYKSGKAGKQLKLKGIPCSLDDINSNTMFCTGVKGYEFGLLDYIEGGCLFFDATGKYTGTVKLPSDAPVNYSFWASYANGQLFLYNADTRTWTGYKLFR